MAQTASGGGMIMGLDITVTQRRDIVCPKCGYYNGKQVIDTSKKEKQD